jgi:hypothetical protein
MSVRESLRKNRKPKIDSSLSEGKDKVCIRALSGAGRAQYMEMVRAAEEAKTDLKSHQVAALGLCEEDGTLIYDVNKDEDLAELKDLDGGFLASVSLKLFEISGLSAKAAEDTGKNSNASPNADSGSGSPSPSAAP